MPPLTDAACKNAKPGAKPLKLFDAGGLFLLVAPKGGKWWRFKYRFEGKEKLLSLGVYPDVALGGHKDKQTGQWIDGVRDKRDQARKLLASGTDPGAVRKTEKAEKLAANANTFEAVAREWHGLPKRKGNRAWSAETAAARLKRLEQDVFPVLGSKPIAVIRKPDLEKLLLDIAGRGTFEVARRVQHLLVHIFRHASREGGPIIQKLTAVTEGDRPGVAGRTRLRRPEKGEPADGEVLDRARFGR